MKAIMQGFADFFRWCFDFPKKHGKSVFDCMFLAIGFIFRTLLGLLILGVMAGAVVGLPALILHLIGVI